MIQIMMSILMFAMTLMVVGVCLVIFAFAVCVFRMIWNDQAWKE